MATESFFSNASLAYLASAGAGKDGKTYSIKPTDGTGDFTFSRGSNLTATRVGADGLIEKGRENLLEDSNDFDPSTTAWNPTTAYTLTSGQEGYDGTNDAWLLNKTNTSNDYFQQRSIVGMSGNVITISIYAKDNNIGGLTIYNVNGLAKFNLTGSGSIISNTGIDAKIEPVGNGWFRCSLSVDGGTAYDRLMIKATDENGADASGSIYIQDAQLEVGLAATEYIESGASTGKAGLLEDEPRFDYSGGATCPSLLLEPSRTQLIPQSEYLEGSDWSSQQTTETLENVTNPQGTNATYKVCANASNLNHYFERAVWTGATSGVDYVFSFFAKAEDSDFVQVATSTGFAAKYQNFNLSNGTLGNGDAHAYGYTSTIEAIGTNGWYRITMKATTINTNSRFLIIPILSDVSARNPIFLGDGTTGFYMWGAQLEQASYPTSYIPNHSGGTATRDGDLDDWVNNQIDTPILFGLNDDFTLYFNGQSIGDEIERTRFMLIGGGYTGSGNDHKNRFWISESNKLRLDGDGGISMGSATLSSDLPEQTDFKVLARKNGSTIDFFLNGQKQTTTQGTNSAFAVRTLFGSFNNFYVAYGRHKQVLIFPEALSDADCISLTTL